jgi:hypothetical protein
MLSPCEKRFQALVEEPAALFLYSSWVRSSASLSWLCILGPGDRESFPGGSGIHRAEDPPIVSRMEDSRFDFLGALMDHERIMLKQCMHRSLIERRRLLATGPHQGGFSSARPLRYATTPEVSRGRLRGGQQFPARFWH